MPENTFQTKHSRHFGITPNYPQGSEGVVVEHWHANQVGGMSFAPRSEVLFSGGAESVLVKWLDGQPQFLPRIGGG